MEDDEVFGIVPEDVLQVIAYSMAELKTVEAVHIVAVVADDEAREVVEDNQDNLGMAAVAEAVQEWESRLLEQMMNSRAFEGDTRWAEAYEAILNIVAELEQADHEGQVDNAED
jgi:hypothetical protein